MRVRIYRRPWRDCVKSPGWLEMGFKFRFERIVQHRQRLIDEQGRAVALAGKNVAQVQGRIDALNQKIVIHQHQHLSRNGEAVDLAGMISRTRWVAHLAAQMELATEELSLVQAELDDAQLKLQEAWRNKEILEKLRLKQHAQWRVEEAKLERQELDEIGQVRADRQRRARVQAVVELSAR